MRRLSALFAVILLISCLFQPAAAVEEVILEDMQEEEIILEEPPAEELPVEEILSEEPAPEDIEDAPDPVLFAAAPEGPSLYFGLLHAHSSLSGGEGAPEEAYAYARDVAGLDFFALTDHSDSFDNAGSASLEEDAASLSLDWAAGKTAAREETTDDFLALFGFEMSWPRQKQLGHISVLFTPGFQSWEQPDFSSAYSGLETFYETLAALSGAIGQFNHPGTEYGTFSDFDHYSESIDRVITLLEIGSGEGTVGGPGYFSALDDYFRALDKGWHLAPVCNQANHQGAWGTANSLRTAVWADSLTEAGLQEALAAYRVYATEDSDLEIHYTLDGHFMGSRVKTWQIGETADITVSLHDPTDDAVGLVEVLTEGGKVLFSQNLEESDGILSVSLLPEYEYYCIKVTQPDGDTALTAPVWVEGIEEAGIQALTCETAVPVQGEPTELTLRLYNREPVPMEVEEVTVSVDGEAIFTQKSPEETEDLSFPLTITHAGVGSARVEVSVSVSLGGAVRIYSEEISLFFRQSDMVRDVIVDGTHDNFLPEELTALEALAAEENIRLRVETEAITPEMLESCGLLILPPPGKAYDSAFLDRLKSYAAYAPCS